MQIRCTGCTATGLSKAFLFNPDKREGDMLAAFPDETRASRRRQAILRSAGATCAPLDDAQAQRGASTNSRRIQIINTALNIQNSRYANQRGRNADFFVFTPQFTGSNATYYVRTKDMEERAPDLDLGAAMAVSGAAASSNMGSNTIKVLSPDAGDIECPARVLAAQSALDSENISCRAILQVFDQLFSSRR